MTGLITEYMGAGVAASRPATPAVASGATAFYYATDTNVLSVWDGSAWDTAGGGSSLWTNQPPTTALFATQALGTGVTLGINGGAKFYSIQRTDGGAGAGAERCGFQGKAVPAGAAWTATMGWVTTPFGGTAKCRTGLTLYESGTGKYLTFIYDTEAGAPQLYTFRYTDLNTFGAVVTTGPRMPGGAFPFLQRVSLSGSNYVFEYSLNDGESWETFTTIAVTTAFTTAATHVGIGLNQGSTQVAGENRADIFYYSDPDFP